MIRSRTVRHSGINRNVYPARSHCCVEGIPWQASNQKIAQTAGVLRLQYMYWLAWTYITTPATCALSPSFVGGGGGGRGVKWSAAGKLVQFCRRNQKEETNPPASVVHNHNHNKKWGVQFHIVQYMIKHRHNPTKSVAKYFPLWALCFKSTTTTRLFEYVFTNITDAPEIASEAHIWGRHNHIHSIELQIFSEKSVL